MCLHRLWNMQMRPSLFSNANLVQTLEGCVYCTSQTLHVITNYCCHFVFSFSTYFASLQVKLDSLTLFAKDCQVAHLIDSTELFLSHLFIDFQSSGLIHSRLEICESCQTWLSHLHHQLLSSLKS